MKQRIQDDTHCDPHSRGLGGCGVCHSGTSTNGSFTGTSNSWDPSLPGSPSPSPHRPAGVLPSVPHPVLPPASPGVRRCSSQQDLNMRSGRLALGASGSAAPAVLRRRTRHPDASLPTTPPRRGSKVAGAGPSDAPGSAVRSSRGAGQSSHGSSRPDRQARRGRP